jgi:hypothetical protein
MKLLDAMCQKPATCIHALADDRNQELVCGRFLAHNSVSYGEMLTATGKTRGRRRVWPGSPGLWPGWVVGRDIPRADISLPVPRPSPGALPHLMASSSAGQLIPRMCGSDSWLRKPSPCAPPPVRLGLLPKGANVLGLVSSREAHMKILVVGYRGGWPGTYLERLVSHAVYKLVDPDRISAMKTIALFLSGSEKSVDSAVDMYNDALNLKGVVRGYGVVSGKGTIVNDADAVEKKHQNYTWLEPALTLSDRIADDFEECAKYQAAQVVFTGIGGNCFTAAVKALEDLKDVLRREGVADLQEQTARVDRLLTQLGGMNFGMGTSISNEQLLSSSNLFQVQSYLQTSVMKVKVKTD